jgi:eukaryotic-like serine/threonine-protein kinase
MPAEPNDKLVGQLVAERYRVIGPLGEGGMGQVYLAEHEAIEKKVALKVLRPEYTHKEDIVIRFQQEAISASRIKHPNVLDVFDFGRLDSGEAFLAMEFLEGHDLSDELEKCKVMEPTRALHIAHQICRALAAAHSRGVVHRDMKPDNVFLQRSHDGDEIVKIVDFGIAQLRTTEEVAKVETTRRRLTKTGMIFGTPEYMAPEQAAGKHADLRVDVYAVGVILYEMFTGAVPFTGDSFMAVLAATLNEKPPAMIEVNPELAIGPELEAVIMKALAKSPDDRFGSMAELSAALMETPEWAALGRMSHLPMPTGPFSAVAGAPTAALGGVGTRADGSPSTDPISAQTSAFGTNRDATSDTQLSGETAPAQGSPSPGRGLILGSIGLVAAGGALLAFLVFGRGPTAEPALAGESEATPVEPAPSAIAPAPTAAPTPMPEDESPTALPSAAPEEEPQVTPQANEVVLHVETEPPGAILTKDGFQVCEETPCDVIVDRKEGVTLTPCRDRPRSWP